MDMVGMNRIRGSGSSSDGLRAYVLSQRGIGKWEIGSVRYMYSNTRTLNIAKSGEKKMAGGNNSLKLRAQLKSTSFIIIDRSACRSYAESFEQRQL